MKYVGGKFRIAKQIHPIMASCKIANMPWVEPFVGGGNMISCASGERYGYDINPHAISALKLIRDNVELLPNNNTEFTKEDYLKVRKDPGHPLHGFACFCYSFGAKYADSWATGGIDYVAQAYRSAKKQSTFLSGVTLDVFSYEEIVFERSCL